MGWIILLLGVALWAGAHLLKRLAPELRASLGEEKGKGPVALALLASIVLMVIGYRAVGVVQLWYPPAAMTHLNNLLVLIAIYMMSPAPKKGRLLNGMRHPMLAGFGLWAAAHLLVNGDLASILLFGGLLAWSLVAPVLINRAEPAWTPPAPGTLAKDAMFLAASAVLLLLIGWVHVWLGYCPFSNCDSTMKIYRFLTEDDTSAFCHKVSEALSKGWHLHGDPAYAFDAARGVMRCGQAVVKDAPGNYSPELKLGEQ